MGDPTRKAMTFHDFERRESPGAPSAARLKVKQRAGHRAFLTTEGYIREAENLADGLGEVFLPMPPSLPSVQSQDRPRAFGVGFRLSAPCHREIVGGA